MNGFHCFSLRRLAPFRSTVQVVQDEWCRAVSYDGVNWQLQLRCERPLSRWDRFALSLDRRASYALFAVWSAADGIAWLPRNPALCRLEMEWVASALLEVLPRLEVPFPAGDPYELWWLDPDDEPLALLGSATDPEGMAEEGLPRWQALPGNEQQFGPEGQLCEALKLERLVRDNAGGLRRVQWFRREADGGGVPVAGGPLGGEATVEAERFPELPLRERWRESRAAELVRTYLHWLAPALLTLPQLRAATRARLERAARQRALEVDALHRLYPQVIDRDGMCAALVEAALRKRV